MRKNAQKTWKKYVFMSFGIFSFWYRFKKIGFFQLSYFWSIKWVFFWENRSSVTMFYTIRIEVLIIPQLTSKKVPETFLHPHSKSSWSTLHISPLHLHNNVSVCSRSKKHLKQMIKIKIQQIRSIWKLGHHKPLME